MPNSIVLDDEVMAKFEVKPQCSEPAAYAVCAMKEYQFKPKAGEKIFYSVFDFVGGTTDMIFGIWRAADKRNRKESRVSWVIEQFKDEGDRYLGGKFFSCPQCSVFSTKIVYAISSNRFSPPR